mgnify:CR=1 FL=1
MKIDKRKLRGDYFYYIKIYDKNDLRLHKIGNILDETVKIKKRYLGTFNSLNGKKYIFLSTFWKNKENAISKIKSLEEKVNKKKLKLVIGKLNRKEFINAIPDKIPRDITKSERNAFLYNFDRKVAEEKYIKEFNLYE